MMYPLSALPLRVADMYRQAALRRYSLFLKAATMPDQAVEWLAPRAALRAAEHARRRVPAYGDLLARHGWRDNPRLPAAERLRLLPVTDKDTYVNVYRTDDRCVDGAIPSSDVLVDESSGSSGKPYNWVRSTAELRDVHLETGHFVRYTCGAPAIVVNGFSMGSWATGVNVGEALRGVGVVKSTGPDVDKILDTLSFFGPRYPYLITGYPPFLKHLLDEGDARGFDWSAFRMTGLVGGEGMSEGLRAYLEHRFQAVYSGYGASDLDIGVAGESPLSVLIRKAAAQDRQLQRALFGDDPRLPMLFQFNPLDYYIETSDQGELIVTINRLNVLSPRIRYNIHDAGGTLRFDSMLAVLRDFGLDPLRECRTPAQPIMHLPFLYLFGRSDSTISYMGANIYPSDVEEALLGDPDDARWIGAHCLELVDIGGGEQRVCVHVEALSGAAYDARLAARLRQRVLDGLLASNRDFRTAVAEDPSAGEILVRLHRPGQGPFRMNGTRIKRRYIVGSTAEAVAAREPAMSRGGV